MDKPIISVIMPNLNGAKRLQAAIDSVLTQDGPACELVAIDRRSTDGSHDILSKVTSVDSRLRWLPEVDSGLSDAINRGIVASQGEIIGYLGSDDEYLPGIFAHVEWLAQRVDFDALLCASYTYHVAEKRCNLQVPPVRQVTRETLLEHGTIAGLQNIFYRRRVFDAHRFDTCNRYSMDYQLLWDLVEDETERCFTFSGQVASLNYFEGNLSHNNRKQDEEAMAIAEARRGDYVGPLWYQWLLPPPPPPPSKPPTLVQKLQGRLRRMLGIAT